MNISKVYIVEMKDGRTLIFSKSTVDCIQDELNTQHSLKLQQPFELNSEGKRYYLTKMNEFQSIDDNECILFSSDIEHILECDKNMEYLYIDCI